MRGTHRGPFEGLALTGRRVTVSLMVIQRVADGRIVEAWSHRDGLGLLRQLAVPVGEQGERGVAYAVPAFLPRCLHQRGDFHSDGQVIDRDAIVADLERG